MAVPPSPEISQVAKQVAFDVVAFMFLYSVVLVATWKSARALRVGGSFVFLALVVFCARGMPELLARPLLARAQALTIQSRDSGCAATKSVLVVLGGGVLSPEVLGVNTQLRVVEAAKIVKQASQEKRRLRIVLTGGVDPALGALAEAPVMKRSLFLELGDGGRDHDVLLEDKSTNTHQNAVNTRELLLAKKAPLDAVLVTGALHLERAVRTFEKAGFTVCPVAAPAAELRTTGLASFRAGAHSVAVLNEHLGMWAYKFKGWN